MGLMRAAAASLVPLSLALLSLSYLSRFLGARQISNAQKLVRPLLLGGAVVLGGAGLLFAASIITHQ